MDRDELYTIDKDGLTLEEAESRIIELWENHDISRDEEQREKYLALKKARMEYLDALNIDEEWLFTEDYEKRRRSFERRTQQVAHRNFMFGVESNLDSSDKSCSKTFEAEEYWYFAPEDEHTSRLMEALSEGKLIEITSICNPGNSRYSWTSGHPTYRYGIAYDHTHGYDARFYELKESLSLADNDIVTLVNLYVDCDIIEEFPQNHSTQRSLLRAIEGTIRAKYGKVPDEDVTKYIDWRKYLLNIMYENNPVLQEELFMLNDTLARLENILHEKSIKLWETIKQSGLYTDEWYIEGALDTVREKLLYLQWEAFIDKYGFRSFDSDSYFGSNFRYMITLIDNIQKWSLYQIKLESTCNPSEECEAKKSSLVGEQAFEDSVLNILKNNNITPCHTMESLLLRFSIPDILHLDRFDNSVNFVHDTIYNHKGNTNFKSEIIIPDD